MAATTPTSATVTTAPASTTAPAVSASLLSPPGTPCFISPAYSTQNRFAFTQCEFDGSSNIWVFNLEMFSSTQLTPDAGTESQPDWSPDGSTVAFTKMLRGGNTAVFAIDADGTNQRPITPRNNRLKESDPSWLPA